MDIHVRAAELVRQSRGALSITEAYKELSRRAHRSRRYKSPQPAKPVPVLWYLDPEK